VFPCPKLLIKNFADKEKKKQQSYVCIMAAERAMRVSLKPAISED
jgi:hypothetical protein